MVDATLVNGPGPRWKFVVRDIRVFREKVGDEVLASLCACFVHTDRLTSLITFMYASLQHYAEDTVVHSRNLHTMVWFVVGTLRELALALRAFRSALAKRGLLDPNSAAWIKLREVEARWDGDRTFRDFRDKVAFHVDRDVVTAGLDGLHADETEVTFCEGDGSRDSDTSFRIGLEALLKGMGMPPEAYEPFFQTVREDHGIGRVLQEAVNELMEKLDIVSNEQNAEVM